MKKKSIIKMILDLLMTILLSLLMIQALAGEELHEWMGIFMFLLFIMHHLINFNWHKNLLKGKYDVVRSIGTLVNAGILICMILSAISGILLSQYLFVFFRCQSGNFICKSFTYDMHTLAVCTYIVSFRYPPESNEKLYSAVFKKKAGDNTGQSITNAIYSRCCLWIKGFYPNKAVAVYVLSGAIYVL